MWPFKKHGDGIKLKDRISMYDMALANMYSGDAIIEPSVELNSSEISVGYANIASASYISQYFIIRRYPDYISTQLFDRIRNECIFQGVKINFYVHTKPHTINWESPEMRSRLRTWKEYTDNTDGSADAFEYRGSRDEMLAKRRMIDTTMYLSKAELDQKRTTLKANILIEIVGERTDVGILNLTDAVKALKKMCQINDIVIKPLKNNLVDWLAYLNPFSLRYTKEVDSQVGYKLMTDDVLAVLSGYKQGKVGTKGVPLGIDVKSRSPVLWNFKEDPDAAENWLISAATGGGKSYFVKPLLTYLMAKGMVVMVMDFEGDEYTNLADYIYDGNPDDVRVVSMGRGSSLYCDPMEIPPLTGEADIDADLKDSAKQFTLAIFRIILHGTIDQLSQDEERVISKAIKAIYDKAGVTEDRSTWKKSKGLRIEMVYREVARMVKSGELLDETTNNAKHKAAVRIADASSVYFDIGESKYGAFKNPIAIEELYRAQLVIFSFGLKGQAVSQIDPTILALKQLSVSNISIQLSNYSKYVKHCFNVKVWEEYQRWGEAEGSAEIICNAMTGGRKRGDINFIITNDLSNMLDSSNKVSATLSQNIQGMAIGYVKSTEVIHRFCEQKDLPDLEPVLRRISKDSGRKVTIADASGRVSAAESMFSHAFCLVLPDGRHAVTKVQLPKKLATSKLFRTGVDISER